MTNPLIKVRTFLNEVLVELKKSAWPTRPELVDSTIVVLTTVVLLGLFVSGVDLVLIRVVRWIIGAA